MFSDQSTERVGAIARSDHFSRFAEPRVGGFLQSFADQVVGQHCEENRRAGKHDQPPHRQVAAAGVEQHAPTRVGGRGAEAEKAQGAFDQDRGGDAKRDRHQHRRQGVGQDVSEHDPQRTGAERASRRDEFAFAQLEELSTSEPGNAGPASDAEHGHDVPDRRLRQ